MHPIDGDWIENIADPDQTAPSGAVWSKPALFAQTFLLHFLEFLGHYFARAL